jgi:hypothetical protein
VRADFLSAAPDDLRDLNTARDGRPFRRMFHWPHVARKCGTGLNVEELTKHAEQMRRGVGAYSERARWRDVIRNPVAATVHFDRRVTTMGRVLLGVDPTRCQSPPYKSRPMGVLGRLSGCAALPMRCGGSDAGRVSGAGSGW